jgi:hypothetical protein
MVDKAVYSFWSKPMNQNNVGFNSEEAFANCLKLSVFYSRKYFKQLEMVTDSYGLIILKKWGISEYFDSIKLDFDWVLNGVSIQNWALGKIWACKIQKEPFIHIDNDVILFKQLDEKILNADCCFQNYEIDYEFYKNLLIEISDKSFKPSYLNINIALNCGIILFNKNFNLIDLWWEDALLCASNLNIDYINLLFEQSYIYGLLINNNVNITVLTDFDEISMKNNYISDEYSNKIGYTHLISNSKRDIKNEEKIKKRLIKDVIKLSVITTCKDRVDFLLKSLKTWLYQDYKRFDIIVVCYNDLDSYELLNNQYGYIDYLKIVNYIDEEYEFNLSRARNVGSINSDSDAYLFMDADMIMSDNEFINNNIFKLFNNQFLVGVDKDRVNGACLVMSGHFKGIFGYNESIVGWGMEDIDLYRRLNSKSDFLIGLEVLDHNNHIRTKFYKEKDINISNKINADIIGNKFTSLISD